MISELYADRIRRHNTESFRHVDEIMHRRHIFDLETRVIDRILKLETNISTTMDLL